MKRLLILTLLALQCTLSGADTQLEQTIDRIGECLDNVERLDEARRLIDSTLSLPGIDRQPLYLQLLYHQSTYNIYAGNMELAKQELTHLITRLPAEGLPELDICVPQDLGVCFRREGQNDSALHYYDRALAAAQQQNDLEWLSSINLNIGILHFNLGHYSEAESYLDHAVELTKQIDDPFTKLCALQLSAGAKLRLEKTAEARTRVEQAYAQALQSGSPDWQLRCITIMIDTYDKLQLPDSTASALERGNQLLPLLPQQGITAIGYRTARGDYYAEHGQWELGATDLQAVLDSRMGGVNTFNVFNKLAMCYENMGLWQLAYRYKDSASVCAQRQADERFAQQLADFNVRYQTMEKDMEISRLQHLRARTYIIVAAATAILAILLLGIWLWRRQRRQRREAQMRVATLEQERHRIARELHDGLCNDMLALEMRMTADGHAADMAAQLNKLRQQARSLSHQLMPPEFTHLSLHELLQLYAANTSKTESTEMYYTASAAATAAIEALPPDVSRELYRIVQEHTSNILKGATASHIDIVAERPQPNMLKINIADDGQPATTDPTRTDTGIGNRTMRDRALSIGAHMAATTLQGRNLLCLTLQT